MVYKTLNCFPKGKKCHLCLTALINPQALGNICQTADVFVHYFCLLLASKIQQKGTDKQGLLGFFSRDIKKEIKRGSTIACSYCRKKGATVTCSGPNCSLNFHVPCAQDNGSLHQYFSEFKSFCEKHKPRQKIPVSLRKKEEMDCVLCCHKIILNSTSYEDDYLWPSCCKPEALLHKKCLQSFALNAGYYFKCPFCSNKTEFHTGMKTFGIYIPEQEASWETEPNAYRELIERDVKCDAKTCVCPRGRDYSVRNSKWYLELCSLCGASGLHRGCMSEIIVTEYECETCSPISSKFAGSVTLNDTGNVAEPSPIANGEVLNNTMQHPVQENTSKNASIECVDIVVISDSESEEVNVEDIDEVPSVVNLRKRKLHSRLDERQGQKRQRLAAGGAETSSEMCFALEEENDGQLPHTTANSSFRIDKSPNCHQTCEINPQNTNINECPKSPIVNKDTIEEPLLFTISEVFTLNDFNEVDFDTNVICDSVNQDQDPVDESNASCIVLSSGDEVISIHDEDSESNASNLLDSESSLLDLSEIPEAERSLLLDHFSSNFVNVEKPSEASEKPKRRRKKKKKFTHVKKRKSVNSTIKGKSNKRSIQTLNDKLINKLPVNDSVVENTAHFSNINNPNLSISIPVSSVSTSNLHAFSIAEGTASSTTVSGKSIVGMAITQENKKLNHSNSATYNVNNEFDNVNHNAIAHPTTENVDLLSSSENNKNITSPFDKIDTANYNESNILKTFLHTAEVHLCPNDVSNDSTSVSKNLVTPICESVRTDVGNSSINSSTIDKTLTHVDLDNNKIIASLKTCSNTCTVETLEKTSRDSCIIELPPINNKESTNMSKMHGHLAVQKQSDCAFTNTSNSDNIIVRDNSNKLEKSKKRKNKSCSLENKEIIKRENVKKLNKNNGDKPKIICSLLLEQSINKEVIYSLLNSKKKILDTSSSPIKDNIPELSCSPKLSDCTEVPKELQLCVLDSSDGQVKSWPSTPRIEDQIELLSTTLSTSEKQLEFCSEDKELKSHTTRLDYQKELQSSKSGLFSSLSRNQLKLESSKLNYFQVDRDLNSSKLSSSEVKIALSHFSQSDDQVKLQSSEIFHCNDVVDLQSSKQKSRVQVEFPKLNLSKDQVEPPSSKLASYEDSMKSSNVNSENLSESPKLRSKSNSSESKVESQSSKLNISGNQPESLPSRLVTSGDLLQSYKLSPSEDQVELQSYKLDSTEDQIMLHTFKSNTLEDQVKSLSTKLNILRNQLESLPSKLNPSEESMKLSVPSCSKEKTAILSSEQTLEGYMDVQHCRLSDDFLSNSSLPDNFQIKKPDWYKVCKTDCSTCRNSIDLVVKSDMPVNELVSDCDHDADSMDNVLNAFEPTHSVANHQIGKSNLSLSYLSDRHDATAISEMAPDKKICKDLKSRLNNSFISSPSSSNFSSEKMEFCIGSNRDSDIYFSSETVLLEPEIITSLYSLPQTCDFKKNCEEIKTTLGSKFSICNLPDVVLSAETITNKVNSFKYNSILDSVQHVSSKDSGFVLTSKIDVITSIEEKNPLNPVPEFKKCINNNNEKSESSVTMVPCNNSVTLESECRDILFKNFEVHDLKDDLKGQREESDKSKKELMIIKYHDKHDQTHSENSSTNLQKQFVCNINNPSLSEKNSSFVTSRNNNIEIVDDALKSIMYPNIKALKDLTKAETNLEHDTSSENTSKAKMSSLKQIEDILESKIICDEPDNTTENKNATSDLVENLQVENAKKSQIVIVKFKTDDSCKELFGPINKSTPRIGDQKFYSKNDNHEKLRKSSCILNKVFKVRIGYEEVNGDDERPPLISRIETLRIINGQIFKQRLIKTFFFDNEKKAVIYTDNCGFRYVRLFVENIPKIIDCKVIFQSEGKISTYLKSLIECHSSIKMVWPQVVLIISGQPSIPDKDVFNYLELASKLTNIKLVITTLVSKKYRILEFNKKLIHFSHVYGYHIWDISKIEFERDI